MNWLARQSFLGVDSDEILTDLTVGIVGLGGGGSHVSQQLAHMGIGGFVLLDPDTCEDSNLNRLVGATAADAKDDRPKVDIAARLILSVNPRARVTKHQLAWQEAPGSLKICDIIIGGLDSVRAKDELERFCRRFLIPYIDMGMDVHTIGSQFLIAGQVILSSPGGPCLRCLGVVTEGALAAEGARYGAAGGRPQVVWPNGVLASLAVGLVTQLVCPWQEKPIDTAYFEYDGNKNTVMASSRLQAISDRVCPHHPPNETGELRFDIRKPWTIPSTSHQPRAKRPWWKRMMASITRRPS